VNTGSGATPFFLSLSSGIGGSAGRLLVDTGSVDLGLTVLSEGRDAEILFGDSDPALGLVIRSSTNQFHDIVGGLDVTAMKASTSAITIDVAVDVARIKDSVKALVTSFNDVIGRIAEYDKYNVDTKTKGVLLGNPTLARTRQLLYGTVQGRARNVSGQYQFLTQVGIRVGKDGRLVLDEAKFDAAYAADPQAVERLFATFEQQTVAPQSPAPGVTVGGSSVVSTALGFGDLLDQATKSLTSTVDGLFTRASQQFETLIERTNSRITNFDARLEARKSRLQRQFAVMEEAIAKLQSQQGALASILLQFQR
jgi:flagellar hook-associated protein 2